MSETVNHWFMPNASTLIQPAAEAFNSMLLNLICPSRKSGLAGATLMG